jgi:hypothetical protein
MFLKNELVNEIVRFNGLFFSINFFNELTIKCVIRFGGFVKISKDPWQLMMEMFHFEIFSIIGFFIIVVRCKKYTFIIHFLAHSLMDGSIIIFVIGHVNKW